MSEYKREPIARWLKFHVIQRDGFTCQYCGSVIEDREYMHIDHVWPVSKGGINNPFNLAVSCCNCNLEKYNKITDETFEVLSIIFKKEIISYSNYVMTKKDADIIEKIIWCYPVDLWMPPACDAINVPMTISDKLEFISAVSLFVTNGGKYNESF